MRIGTIGAGEVAQSFAKKALSAGHEIVFSNSRGPQSLTSLVEAFGPGASAGTLEDAARQAMVVLCVPWLKVEETLQSLPSWDGQILIDATNGLTDEGAIDFEGDSSSEIVARLAPGARVVKAMNSLFMENFKEDPVSGNFRRAVFVSSDDRSAANDVADLFESFGFAPVLLGSLRKGGRMQAVRATLAGHDLHLPWPAPRAFPAFNGEPPQDAG